MRKILTGILTALCLSTAPVQANERLVFDYLQFVDQKRIEVCMESPECDAAYGRPLLLAASINVQLMGLPFASITGGDRAYWQLRTHIDADIAKLYKQLDDLAIRFGQH